MSEPKCNDEWMKTGINGVRQEVVRLREQNEYFRGLLDYYKGELIDEHAEVLRLREQFKLAYDWVDMQFPDGGMADFAKYIGDEEE